MRSNLSSPGPRRAGWGAYLPRGLEVSAKALFWSRRAYRGQPLPRRIQRQTRAAVAAMLAWDTSAQWFDFIEEPDIRPLAESHPLLPLKQFRPYLSSRWSRTRRLKVIRDTCRFLLGRGGLLGETLRTGRPSTLARLELGGMAMEIQAQRDPRFRKEGELCLALAVPSLGGEIMSFSFAVESVGDAGIVFYIGCVQGAAEAAEPVRCLTKAMHGLRPRALMVFLAQELASALGATELLGAGDAIQVHRLKHAIHIPGLHRLAFAYDRLWAEAGGLEGFDGWHRLPASLRRRNPETIPPRKRSQYRQRYHLLDQLSAAIRASV